MTFSPAVVASRAASSLLAIPPLLNPPGRSRTKPVIEESSRSTVAITRLPGSCGSPSNRPSTSDSSTSSGARIRLVTMAASRSLSPNVVCNSSTATVSFSLMIGTAPSSMQRQQRVSGVEVSQPVFEIIGGQQNLCGVMAVGVQRPLVGFHQAALPDGGDGLKMGEVGRSARQSEPAHARPDGPGADQHDFSARRQHVVDLFDELLDSLVIELAVAARQHARAHLDDDRGGQRGDFLSQ